MTNSKKGKKILVAALDWGLGHAARLIPIIQLLEQEGCNILLASSGNALQYWQQEMPHLPCVTLPAYNPHYHQHGTMAWAMFLQSPKFLKAIYQEHAALKKIVTEYHIDGIISDNRYGLYHDAIPCVIITHQLFIQTPKSLQFLQPFIHQLNSSFLKKFTDCWVPDVANEPNISGVLSHAESMPLSVQYIGLLSRLSKVKANRQYRFLVLLSGPEPQRTLVEQLLWQQLLAVQEPVCFVRGIQSKSNTIKTTNNIIVHDVAQTAMLNELMAASDVVICRSGYSTLMDLLQLNKQAILIPTQGQTEQEYLASYLEEKKLFAHVKQHDISKTDFNKVAVPEYIWQHPKDVLQATIKDFIAYL
jgi:uncharacterized protein (TIGR00661 family)